MSLPLPRVRTAAPVPSRCDQVVTAFSHAGSSLNRTNSAKSIASMILDNSDGAKRRITRDFSQLAKAKIDENEEDADEQGGVSESVVDDLKGAFGTDFKVDSALIDAILRRNCIAFVGAGFSQNETKMTWDCLIEKLLVRALDSILLPPPAPIVPPPRCLL